MTPSSSGQIILDNQISDGIRSSSGRIPSSISSESKDEWTISELRARQELKVARDKRHLVHVKERLQRDEIDLVRDETRLVELQREEARLEAKEWGF